MCVCACVCGLHVLIKTANVCFKCIKHPQRWTLRKLGVDEWLIRTFMALYTEAFTVVRTDAGQSESFEVKVGLHQRSAEFTDVCCCHGCCLQCVEKWSAFRVAVR